MNKLKFCDIKNLITHLKNEGLSLRKRFTFFLFLIICLLLAVVIFLLNMFGILNLTDRQMKNYLSTQLRSCSDRIGRDCDELAACAISFSEQLEASIQDYLSRNNITFDELKNNPEAIETLQNELYDSVYLNMQVSSASGAFYILNTTVNSNSDTPLYSGLYLKYINLYSENTVNNEFSIFRGSFSIGKNRGINFHSGWRNESKTDFFDKDNIAFSNNSHYVLSPIYEIPDTWEKARYVYVPIYDYNDNIIGVCGFETNDLMFQLTHKTETGQWGNVICGFLDESNGLYSGQFSINRYNNPENGINIKNKKGWQIFDFGNEQCIGLTQTITLENETFYVAAMLPQMQYENFIRKERIKIAVILLVIVVFASICCVFMNKKYISPILRKIEQLKAKEDYGENLGIREIDDLFAFLEEKDNNYEKQLANLQKEKQLAENEARKAKENYEKSIEKYELAKNEIDRLINKHKEEIIPDKFNYFVENLSLLTPAEYRIYELYLSGKTAKEIVDILHITENTVKYHNKNIYSKLGISSRKQLLQFALLKQHMDNNNK